MFLTEGQVNGFHQSGILRDNFVVRNVNVHYPVPGTETETQLFNSTNYLVELKPERLALAEYQPFDGLRAEVQVQTLLNHAWAEMGHDTIYKQPKLVHVGEKRLTSIKDRMDTVMRERLLPAGHDFDKIARDFAALLAADEGYEEAVATLTTSSDNNALDETIGVLDDRIVPQFGEPAAQFSALLPLVVDAVERTRGSAATPVQSPYGDYPGRSGLDVARKAASLVRTYRYRDLEQTFATLLRLHGGAGSPEERDVWSGVAREFSKYDLAVWKRYGPAVQQAVVAEIGKLGAGQRREACSILAAMLGNILSAELGGTTATSMTVQIHQGSVPISEALQALRQQAIGQLVKLLDDAADDGERRLILDALRKAGTTPYHGGGAPLLGVVMANGAQVLAIERARAEGWGLELRRWSETDALRLHHWFRALPPHLRDDEQLAGVQRQLMDEVIALRDQLNADPDFVLYKTLVGHDTVRPGAWDGAAFDFEATAAWRAERHAAIVDEIDPDTAANWIERCLRYIAEPKSTGGELLPMIRCLSLLAKTKPAVAAIFLDRMDDAIAPILLALLEGIAQSADPGVAAPFVARWVEAGRYLADLALFLRTQEPLDRALLVAVTECAIEVGDENAVVVAINTVAERYHKAPEAELVSGVFMPALAFMLRAKKPQWVNGAWGLRRQAIIDALDEPQCEFLLLTFIGLPEINYQADQVLAAVATRFPGRVLMFFENRIEERRRGVGRGSRFEPIPFSIHDLREPLSRDPAGLVDRARLWHRANPSYHQFEGGRLIGNVFPELTSAIADQLSRVVAIGDPEALRFVLTTLLAYEGSDLVYPLCMDIVDRLEPDDDLLARVSDALGATGVVTGEYGFVEASGAQRARLAPWLRDPRPKVRAYIINQVRQLGHAMAAEQRRASYEVAQRQRDWGEE